VDPHEGGYVSASFEGGRDVKNHGQAVFGEVGIVISRLRTSERVVAGFTDTAPAGNSLAFESCKTTREHSRERPFGGDGARLPSTCRSVSDREARSSGNSDDSLGSTDGSRNRHGRVARGPSMVRSSGSQCAQCKDESGREHVVECDAIRW
jgi:hypothetical protein